MRVALSVCAALVTGVCSAQAEMLQNQGDWSGLAASGKAGYAAGLFDALMMSNDPNALLAPAGLMECRTRLKLSPAALAEAVDAAYSRGADKSTPPSFVFVQQVTNMCRSDLNAVRRAKGLGPIPE